MTEKAATIKADALPDLDDLLQCPVCYEIPTGQIFQCNEGHHVCGRCKVRLDVCPVCRAFFFGTRNYAMEELIANIRRLRAFKLGGKITTGSVTPEQQIEPKESTSEENDSANEDDAASRESVSQSLADPPRPCSGLFRCLCCKTNPERLPSARLLNHLRYYHSPDLIEGRSDENGEYLQAWEFGTDIGRIVTAVRIASMGLFFLVIEITNNSICTWLVMAASPRVAEEFSYTYTLSGNDREAIFSDCVWSVRTCEGFLKKRERVLCVQGGDAHALLAPATMSAKLRVRRAAHEAGSQHVQPRAVLRVANRSEPAPARDVSEDLEPFLQDLQNDVARLSRAFATLGREANVLMDMQARFDEPAAPAPPPRANATPDHQPQALSRSARRRMRQRLLHALDENMTADAPPAPAPVQVPTPDTDARRANARNPNNRITNEPSTLEPNSRAERNNSSTTNSDTNVDNTRRSNNPGDNANNNQHRENSARPTIRAGSPVRGAATAAEPVPLEAVPPPPVPPPSAATPAANGNGGRNKKKRRQRR